MPQPKRNRIRSKLIEEYAHSLVRAARASPEKLSHGDWRGVLKGPDFLKYYMLDDLLMLSQKLGKRFYIVLVDDDKGIHHHEFSNLFRNTYSSEEANNEAIELAEEHGIVVIGNETTANYLQRTEMFLTSELADLVRIMKRIKGKKVGISDFHFKKEEEELKDLFTHTILRMQFAVMRMEKMLRIYEITQNEFAVMAVLFMSSRPMEREIVRLKISHFTAGKVGSLNQAFGNLGKKGHIRATEKENTRARTRPKLYMLTEKGHQVISTFVQRITNEIIGIPYE